jgi:hypothetical protein
MREQLTFPLGAEGLALEVRVGLPQIILKVDGPGKQFTLEF